MTPEAMMNEDWDPGQTQGLIEKANAGDPEAWSSLYRRHRAVMRLFIKGRIPIRMRSRFETEDVLSSGFLSAYEKLATFEYRGEDSFRRWLTQVLINKLHDKIKHHSRAKRDATREDDASMDLTAIEAKAPWTSPPSEVVVQAESQALVLAAISKLPEDHQEVICLRVFDRLQWEEIAKALQVSQSTARRRLREALERLVEEMLGGAASIQRLKALLSED